MYGLGSGEKPWSCSVSFNPYVDFCIWVLEADGLRVPPFDKHPSGDGTLQAAGLHADEWWSWFKVVDGCLSDRKSTRLNSSHQIISYAVFCLKQKKSPGSLLTRR